MPDLMKEREVAELLRVTRQTLSRWRAADQGPPFVQIEGSIRYRRADLEAWLAERTLGGTLPA
jgi:excisionase family DNA binding protein